MISTLGDIKPAWERRSLTARSSEASTPRTARAPVKASLGVYNVGRTRVRGQLTTALDTQDEVAQLRRLEQALASPARYDGRCKHDVEKAAEAATLLARRLGFAEDKYRRRREAEGGQPAVSPDPAEQEPLEDVPATPEDLEQGAPDPAPATEAEEEQAAMKIQGQFREKKQRDREHARQQAEAKEDAAALRIQSLYRGKAARARVDQVKREKPIVELVEEEEGGAGDEAQ